MGALGVTSAADAVNVNPNGLGQVLIYPYYTVNQTAKATRSTRCFRGQLDGSVKAVKVRFLEGKDSREVLDFNLFLSAYDVWTRASFRATAQARAVRVITTDQSCTIPPIPRRWVSTS